MKKDRTGARPLRLERGDVDDCLSVPAAEPRLTARRETKLEIPVGKSDLETLRSVTREWLVPLLVEKFLREQGIELRARPKEKPISYPQVGDPNNCYVRRKQQTGSSRSGERE